MLEVTLGVTHNLLMRDLEIIVILSRARELLSPQFAYSVTRFSQASWPQVHQPPSFVVFRIHDELKILQTHAT